VKVFEAGAAVTLNIPLLDDEGRPLTPTSMSYRVLDDEGTVIQDATNIGVPSPFTGKVSIQISAAVNTLSNATIGFRRVELTVVTALATEKVYADYLLEAQQPFVVPENSFLTYETALVVARMVTPLNGWNAATAETRKFALFRAFDQMNSFAYQMRYIDEKTEVLTIAELTEEMFGRLQTTQLSDFRKAQLLQADYLLGGSPIEKDIQDGLQSSTIGEVSQFYRPRPTLSLALCRNALGYVGKYIDWNVRLGRA
jgi:hypothetical protein